MQTTPSFTLGFIGGGNMAQALITGLCHQGFDANHILVIEPSADKRSALAEQFKIQTSANLADISQQDVIVLAVKPQQLQAVAQDLAPHLNQQLIISIAAGIRLKVLVSWLAGHTNIIRTMPNTPAQIQAGITGIYAPDNIAENHRAMTESILQSAGETVWVDAEEKLDAVTAISGSGPAYVFYLIEALTEAAITLGLTPAQATLLAKQTFKGASLLADASDTPVNILREQVTSKGGTTAQGLLSLANDDVNTAIVTAAKAAAHRAKTLSDELGK